MTDTKAIEKALRELERVRDIVIHMPQPGNWDIVVNTLVEDIDKLIPSATTALAALLAEREEKRAEIDKLRAVVLAADKLDKAEEQARLSRLSSTTSENEQLRDETEVDFCRAAFRTARDRAGE